MSDILQVEVIENGDYGHRDLLFQVDGLVEQRKFDTYYFGIAIEPFKGIQDIRNAVVSLLDYWAIHVEQIIDGNPIYLPIDFSDQYTGCLQVVKQNKNLQLTYGVSFREGFSVNPLNPGNYCQTINDFEETSERSIEVLQEDFLKSIRHVSNKLKNAS